MSDLQVVVTTVYALSMPKFVRIQIQGVQQALKIHADKVERDGEHLNVTRDGQQVGRFSNTLVQGWWIEDDPPPY